MKLSQHYFASQKSAEQFATRIGFLKLFRISPDFASAQEGHTLVVYSNTLDLFKVWVVNQTVIFESLILAQGERW